jgi:hypothetical protein
MSTVQIEVRESGSKLVGLHKKLMAGQWGDIDWRGFDRGTFSPESLRYSAEAWRRRLADEYRSATVFSQFQSFLLLTNLPVDILGCVSRVVQDEVRHVQLCADLVAVMGEGATAEIYEPALFVPFDPESEAVPQLLSLTIGLFCMGETVSSHLIGATYEKTGHPLVKEAMKRLYSDEQFHAEFGWNLAAVLAQHAEPEILEAIGAGLDQSFGELETMCTSYGEGADDMVLTDEDRLLGSLSVPEHRACFYKAVDTELVPRLEKMGFPARAKWQAREVGATPAAMPAHE